MTTTSESFANLKKLTLGSGKRRRDVIVIGGSAGALEAVRELVGRLPGDLPASVMVVLHIPSDFPSYLADIFDRAGPLRAVQVTERQEIKRGVIYVAPPDRHLLIEDGFLEVSRGPRENRARPAIDPLFRSAARTYGSRVMGVVLSGQLDDGSSGLMAIKMRGGLTVVQDTGEALCPEMPARAKRYAGAEYELPIAAIAELMVEACSMELPVGESVGGGGPVGDEIGKEADKADLKNDANEEKLGKPSSYACPECHGVMWETEEGELLRFRCRVGHAYTADTLRGAMSDAVEDALWAAMRAMEERASLLRRLAQRAHERRSVEYQQEARGFDQHVETIRKILLKNQGLEQKESGKAANR